MSWLFCCPIESEYEDEIHEITGIARDGSRTTVSSNNSFTSVFQRINPNKHMICKKSKDEKTQMLLIFRDYPNGSRSFIHGLLFANGKLYAITEYEE